MIKNLAIQWTHRVLNWHNLGGIMRPYFLILIVANSYGLAQGINPIQTFTPGSYLGHGTFLRSDGTSGYLSSLITLNTSGWNLVQDRGSGLSIYQTNLTIDTHGFVTAVFIDNSIQENPKYFDAVGNCGSTYCQLTADLLVGTLNKLIIFDSLSNTITSYGAIYYTNAPSVQWEEVLYRIPESTFTEQQAPIFQFPY